MGLFGVDAPKPQQLPEPKPLDINPDASAQAAALRQLARRRRNRDSLVIDTTTQDAPGTGLSIPE